MRSGGANGLRSVASVCRQFAQPSQWSAVFLFGTPSFLPTFVSIKWKERLSSGQSTLKLSFRTKFSRVRKEKENWERCGNHLLSLSDRPFLLYPCNSVLGVSLIGEGIVSLVVLRHLRRFPIPVECVRFLQNVRKPRKVKTLLADENAVNEIRERPAVAHRRDYSLHANIWLSFSFHLNFNSS